MIIKKKKNTQIENKKKTRRLEPKTMIIIIIRETEIHPVLNLIEFIYPKS